MSAAVYATLIVTFVGQVARVEGRSMMPTLNDQDRLIVNKVPIGLKSLAWATSSWSHPLTSRRRCWSTES